MAFWEQKCSSNLLFFIGFFIKQSIYKMSKHHDKHLYEFWKKKVR